MVVTGEYNVGKIKDSISEEEIAVLERVGLVSKTPPAEFAERKNLGKVDTTFNPKAATLEWAKVWMFGSRKYARNQWRKLWGKDTVSLALASANRHLLEIQEGNLFDKESGLTHAAHVMCNMAMIIEHMANNNLITPEVYEENLND